MHMADALVSPAVGGTMWAASAAATAYCAKKLRAENDPAKVPLMGVVGAFIFGAQMLNFTIPGTGSSGHLGGGLLLAIILGPEAAFLVMASVLAVQALFMADGGLLALGCNIFNLGFIPAFVAYPLFKRVVGDRWTTGRIVGGSVASAEVALLLGAMGVVLETTLSGVSSLPFTYFVAVMIPIHLAIGLIEGLVTAAVVLFVRQAQPELLVRTAQDKPVSGLNLRPLLVTVALAALVATFALSWFASANPDGLEWSIAKVTGDAEFASGTTSALHEAAASLQEKTAVLPGYELKDDDRPAGSESPSTGSPQASDAGTSVAGLVGAGITLLFVAGVGFALSRRWRHSGDDPSAGQDRA